MLRLYFNWRAIGHGAPYLVHLLIGDGDAAVRPVTGTMSASDPAQSVRQPVHHYVATGRDSAGRRIAAILGIWIRNMNRAVKTAAFISTIQYVNSFRGAVISLVLLWTLWITAECDAVCLEGAVTLQKNQEALLFEDDDFVGARCR